MQTGQPKVDVAAVEAEAKRSREQYERVRTSTLRSLGLESNAVAIEMLDGVYALGISAGGAGETSLVLKEVAETQIGEFQKIDARNKSRDEAEDKRHTELMAVLNKGADAMTRLADAIEEFMEEDDEEDGDPPVPQPRRPR